MYLTAVTFNAARKLFYKQNLLPIFDKVKKLYCFYYHAHEL